MMSDLQPVRMDDFLEADIVVVELQADGETQSFLGCQPLTSKSVWVLWEREPIRWLLLGSSGKGS